VPVKIYYPVSPADGSRPAFPVIIFSHGLGGSRDGYGYLGQHWASCGYVSVHVQHLGSDTEALRGARPMQNFKNIASNPANAINRPLDITFAIDRLTELNGVPSFPLAGRLNLAQLGVAGHSFGAFTTMAVAGARIPVLGAEPRFLDPRIKAAIAMSTPANPNSDTDAAFDGVRIPVFHMTGTADGLSRASKATGDAIVGDTTPAQRLLPYKHTRGAPAYLLVFAGGDHMVFSGRLVGSRPTDKVFEASVCRGSTAFWDAWLKGDVSAKHWLGDGGFASAVGKAGTFEHKP
jgi:predicted dienelactone hydrolase